MNFENVVSNYAYSYFWLKLVAENRIKEAIRIFDYGRQSKLCELVKLYLTNDAHTSPNKNCWEDIKGFDIWNRTSFAIQQSNLTISLVTSKAQDFLGQPPDKSPVIIDVGTGNGEFIIELVNRLSRIYKLKSVYLVLVDHLASALRIARENCYRRIEVPVKVQTLCKSLEELTSEDLLAFTCGTAWLSNASACIHHLPMSRKIRALATLGRVSSTCIITELEGNHDTPLKGSLDLLYSVHNFYECLIADLLESEMSRQDKNSCVQQFLLPEVLALITQDYDQRQNYHCLLHEWISVIEMSGGRPYVLGVQEIKPYGPSSLTICVQYPHP
jgi:hypothetical protein